MPEKTRSNPVDVRLGPIGLSVFSSRHAADFSMPYLYHSFHKLIIAVEGEGSIEIDSHDRAVPWNAGACVIVPAGTRHRLIDADARAMSVLGVCIEPKVLEANPMLNHSWNTLQQAVGQLRPFVMNDLYYRTRIERRVRDMLFEEVEKMPAAADHLWGHFLQLLADVSRCAHPRIRAGKKIAAQDPRFAATLTWLQHQFHEQISVAELASRSGLSYRGFTHRFRRTTGSAVIDYIARLRIAHACRLLQAGTAIVDAAMSAGYADLSHFYRQFKREKGQSPAQWTKANR
jgi:AraC-like DNA-binding protein/mannose-6-phosphate isomerase-like protein (cupin superfamily)